MTSIFTTSIHTQFAFCLNRVEQRFKMPITASEYEKFDKSWVSDASRRKWAWVLKVVEE